MRNEGFTLIELFIVIAIIAILAMILTPVFARTQAEARIHKIINGTLDMNAEDEGYIRNNQSRPVIAQNRDRLDSMMNIEKNAPPKFHDAVSKNIEMVLTDGRVIKVSVMIPRGSEISTISVIPQRLER